MAASLQSGPLGASRPETLAGIVTPQTTRASLSSSTSAGEQALRQALAQASQTLPGGLVLRSLGLQSYLPTWKAMREFTDSRAPDTPDEIWLLEHLPVYTLGQAADPAHVLDPGAIPVIATDRGGQVSYHGPGQAVVYCLLDLRRRRWLVRETVHRLEEAVIRTLARHGVVGLRRPGAPGIYVGAPHPRAGAKVSALGLKVRNGCTYHGVSINVDMDLSPFSGINPCGHRGLQSVDLATLGVHALPDAVAMCFATELAMLAEDLERSQAGASSPTRTP